METQKEIKQLVRLQPNICMVLTFGVCVLRPWICMPVKTDRKHHSARVSAGRYLKIVAQCNTDVWGLGARRWILQLIQLPSAPAQLSDDSTPIYTAARNFDASSRNYRRKYDGFRKRAAAQIAPVTGIGKFATFGCMFPWTAPRRKLKRNWSFERVLIKDQTRARINSEDSVGWRTKRNEIHSVASRRPDYGNIPLVQLYFSTGGAGTNFQVKSNYRKEHRCDVQQTDAPDSLYCRCDRNEPGIENRSSRVFCKTGSSIGQRRINWKNRNVS